MSIVVCDHCDRYIDSDKDQYCFCDDPTGETVMCENCRETAYDRHQESLMENGPGPSLLQQQIGAMKFK